MIPDERQAADINCWQFHEKLATWDRMYAPKICELFPHEHYPDGALPQPNTTVYISGPATGIPDYNKPQFMLAEKMLLSYGCDVFNPARIEGPIDPLQDEALWRYYMHFCIRALPDCSSLLMLPGWEASKGAQAEHHVAQMLGLTLHYSPVLDNAD